MPCHGLMKTDLPIWKRSQMQHTDAHTHTRAHANSLSATFYSALLSPIPRSTLHAVMDQRTCPNAFYRQHTYSVALHADMALQRQPRTVCVCVGVCLRTSSTDQINRKYPRSDVDSLNYISTTRNPFLFELRIRAESPVGVESFCKVKL